MVKIYNELLGKYEIDNRHCVDTRNSISFADAIVINENGGYDYVMYMTDDMRTWDNEVVIDATEEEIKEYRKAYHKFKIGDKVKINRGRKMLGEIKEIKGFYTFRPDRTYGHCDTNYLVFTDGTKVNKLHCDII